MKFTAEQKHLSAILTRMVSVTERRNTIPVLAHVLIQADDYGVNFTATDLDIEIKERAVTNVEQLGSATANAAMFKEIVLKLDPVAIITVQLKDQYLHITSGKSKFKLQTLQAEDFPHIASDEYTSTLVIPADTLKSAIDRTVWAASTEEVRFYLKGIALQSRSGSADFVATDGHRLSHYKIDCDINFPDVIIPTKTAKQLSGVLHDGDASLSISDTKIRVEYGNVVIVSKCVDGQYPDWKRVIPDGLNNSVTVSSEEMSKSIDRVMVVMDEKSKIMKLNIRDGEMVFSGGDNFAIGEAMDSISAEVDGPYIEIGVSAKYAIDAMKQADKGSIKISYKDSMSPLIVTYDKDPNLLVVVMPARI